MEETFPPAAAGKRPFKKRTTSCTRGLSCIVRPDRRPERGAIIKARGCGTMLNE